jgi:penicillin-binding protein 1A
MSEDNKKKSKKKGRKGLKIFLVVLLMAIVISVGAVSGIILSILKDTPKIEPTNISSTLDQTSFILDPEGNVIEKIQTLEFRTIVSLNKMPIHLQEAFISIEDERFMDHIGVDPRGIVSSMIDNLKAGHIVRGASTITQQLARNLYLNNEKKWDRKIKEAYLALQIEKVLTKDQILEGYLNRVNLGQGAYGVQEAAQTYFSKNVENLSLGESALLAGIVKSPSKYAPYKTVSPENFDSTKHYEVGQLDILGEKYIAIYNEEAVKRQKIILNKLLELGKITKQEYDEALNENIKENLKPGQKKIKGISSYFTDYVKTQVVNSLVNELGYTKEQAEKELFTGGLKIYSTMDVKLQRELEDVYNNFTEVLVGNPSKIKGPILVDWRLNSAKDIIDENKNIVYYKQENLLNENYDLVIEKGTFDIVNENLIIKNKKLTPYKKHIDVADYYTIDERKNLVSHTVGSFTIPEDGFSVNENKEITIKSSFLNNNKDFYSVDGNGNLIIKEKYFFRSKDGIVQPQSATVILDYKTGQIKALVGGRDIEGARILNRATASQRQPGSAMKPIAAYLPALDNGFTAASPIDDVPFYFKGKTWPRNWYRGYRGINTLRTSLEQSINVNSVRLVDSVGVKTSMEYLEKLGIINREHPEKDSFITSAENGSSNDENLSALALGGMTKGLTPLEITAAYGAIANGGVYLEPVSFTKILDKNGNLLIDNTPKETKVVSPEVAYVMGDILRTTVSNGIAGRAKISKMAVAGKTGTTTDQADIWFVGFTPYYVSATWIGNDSPKITLTQSSGTAAQLWKHIMTRAHEGLESKTSFDKPAGIVSVKVCTQSGKIPTELCAHDPRGSTTKTEIFVRGTEPKEYCDVHVEVPIDITTGKVANEYCPSENIVNKVFVKRNPPYNPAEHGGVIPSDYQYSVPTGICDIHGPNTHVDDSIDDPFNDEDNDETYIPPNYNENNDYNNEDENNEN